MPVATLLLLDPKLAEEVKAYFRKRADVTGCPFKCVEVPDDEERRNSLRDRARDAGHGAIIALKDRAADGQFFDGAQVRVSTVEPALTGWLLKDFPEAVPLPPAPAPTLWDDACGPLIPDAKLERELASWGKGPKGYGERGAVRSYPIDVWLERNRDLSRPGVKFDWLTPQDIAADGGRSARQLGMALVALACGRDAGGVFLWRHGRRLFRIGEPTPAVMEVEKYHPLEEPTAAVVAIAKAVATRNPWRAEGWAEVEDAVLEACGVSLAPVLRGPTDQWHPELAVQVGCAFDGAPEAHFVSSDAAVDVARTFLRDLAQRDMHSSLDEHAFLFEAMADAPLRCAKATGRLQHSIRLNMGAGRLIHLMAYRFEAETSGPLCYVSGKHSPMEFDGGDVRLRLLNRYAENLEGTHLVPRRRRNED